MKRNWQYCIDKVGISEGGYTNNKFDKGNWFRGRLIGTNHGISAPVLARWLHKTPTVWEMRNLTKKEAQKILKARFWDSLRCDDLPSGVDYTVFDFGVNSGIVRAAQYLQRSVGARPDGIVGGMTLQAVGRYTPSYIVKEVNRRRLGFLNRLSDWRHFGKGWNARVNRVLRDSLAMTQEKVA